MTDPIIRSGSCACGAVAFTADCSNILIAAHCHCHDCQKATGSAFATVVGVTSDRFTLLRGETRSWTVQGQSGDVTREFCPTCGSPLFSASTGSPGVTFVKAGAFDEAGWIEPAIECWTSREQPWARIPAGIHGTPQNPVAP